MKDQDTVLRLRREADAVEPELRPGQVDDVLDQVFAKRARQRGQRARMWGAVAAVVLLVAGASMIVNSMGGQDDRLAAQINEWPLRGSLTGDADLITRAEQVWRQSGVPVGQVRPIYAGRSPRNPINDYMLVVLSGLDTEGAPIVAFVTTLTSNKPSKDTLFVRAETPVEQAPLAVGFVAAHKAQGDMQLPDSTELSFALAAPGRTVKMRNNLVDHLYTAYPDEETFWSSPGAGGGAWNSVMIVDDQEMWPAAGIRDPKTSATKTPEPGDLVVSPRGLVGAIRSNGEVDSSADTLRTWGSVSTAVSAISGTLTNGPDNTLLFTPDKPDGINEGNRVVYTAGKVVVTLGKLKRTDGGWQVERASLGDGTSGVPNLLIGHPR